MYTILVNKDLSLTTSVKTTLIRNTSTDEIWFLWKSPSSDTAENTQETYTDVVEEESTNPSVTTEISYTALLRYETNNILKTDSLITDNETYKGRERFILPRSSSFFSNRGMVQLWLEIVTDTVTTTTTYDEETGEIIDETTETKTETFTTLPTTLFIEEVPHSGHCPHDDDNTIRITRGDSLTVNVTLSNGTISLKDPSNASHNNIEMSYNIISLYDTSSGVDRMMITHSDIEFDSSNTPNTWDGTNTSLKTAVSSKVNKAGDSMTGALTFNKVSNAIHYTGSKADYTMIQFIDNTSDTYGNGIAIGGGGQTIIGGGESATVMKDNAGTAGAEEMWVGNDGDVHIYTNLQNGWANKKTFTFNSAGNLTLPGDLITSTWDGTNTSLKTALANKISKETNTTVSWTSTATGRTVTCMLAKIGTIVICTITGSTDANHNITAWTATQLGAGQIPAGYRPSSAMEGRISTQTGGATLTVNTVGTVAITTWSNLGNQMAFGGTLWWKTS